MEIEVSLINKFTFRARNNVQSIQLLATMRYCTAYHHPNLEGFSMSRSNHLVGVGLQPTIGDNNPLNTIPYLHLLALRNRITAASSL